MPHSVPPPAPPPLVHVLSPETSNKAFTAIPQASVADSDSVADPLVVERVHIPESFPPATAAEPPSPDRLPEPGDAAGAIAPAADTPANSSSPVASRPRYNRPDTVGNRLVPPPETTAAPEATGDRPISSGDRPQRTFRRPPTRTPIPALYSTPLATTEATPSTPTTLDGTDSVAPLPPPRRRPDYRRPTIHGPIPPLYSEQATQADTLGRAAGLGSPIGISLDDFFSQEPPPELVVGVTPPSRQVRQESLGEEQILQLAGNTALLSMLSELQQLDGATLVAQSRQDLSQRQILVIPPNGEDGSGSVETGIPEELQEPSAEESAPPASPEDPLDDQEPLEVAPEPLPDNTPLTEESLPPVDSAEPPLDLPEPPAVAVPEGEVLEDGAIALPVRLDVLELDSDALDYDTVREVLFAQGNVELRFRQAVLTADRVRVNIRNRQAVAEGNVVFTRGEQVLLGDRLDYNITQGAGNVTGVRGEIFLPTSDDDLTILPNDTGIQSLPSRPLSRTITQGVADPPVQGLGGIQFGAGAGRSGSSNTGNALLGGEIRRFRFEAESAEFYPNGWEATNVRLTNDPFSPPELELRSPFVTYTRLSPVRAELRARNPIIVFDQGFRLPLLQDRVIISDERTTPLAQIGFDEELGGLFLERPINLVTTTQTDFSIAPLLLVQRAVDDNNFNLLAPSSLGMIFRLNQRFGPRTLLTWRGVLETLDFSSDNLDEQIRSNVQLRQGIGTHLLFLEYAYNNRFFNGSLGFQDVESSVGFVVTSPNFVLGRTGLNLSYQAGVQYITADTDRPELLDAGEFVEPVSLLRGQASAVLSRGFTLWRGRPLPPTREEGLRFTPSPVVPFVRLAASARGVFSAYSSDDIQATLTGNLSLQGQFGHFSRDAFDYTAFNVTLSETLGEGDSPFRFDRAVDRSVISFGFLQQIYGPIRFGIQTSINLDTSDTIDTVYSLEYSRRTYSIILRFSPIRESGSLNLQINDFDWNNLRDPFSGPTGAVTVESGVALPSD